MTESEARSADAIISIQGPHFVHTPQGVALCAEDYRTVYVPEMEQLKREKAARAAERREVRPAGVCDELWRGLWQVWQFDRGPLALLAPWGVTRMLVHCCCLPTCSHTCLNATA